MRTHGEGGRRRGGTREYTKEYRAWMYMKARCQCPSALEWHGARGVTVCDRWRTSFEAFLADVGRAPSSKHSLDRFPDTDGNYEPGNVRWATAREQRLNQRARSYPAHDSKGKFVAKAVLFSALLLVTFRETPAMAFPCGHGFIYRVHLRECVVASSPMARAYVAFAPNSIRRRGRLAVALPPPLPPPSPPPAPFPLPTLIGIQWLGEPDDETRARLMLRAALKKED